eukprot:Phypoly_transcript_02707.p1 GENE.Phypoly_transcript_02707~~Phypoly_transcript_02707.p1  ORF type:complete len:863 (+),score=100.25 Phypoly_transcript_02707:263-2590(+)
MSYLYPPGTLRDIYSFEDFNDALGRPTHPTPGPNSALPGLLEGGKCDHALYITNDTTNGLRTAILSSPNLNFANDFTISFWLLLNSTGMDPTGVYSIMNQRDSCGYSSFWSIRYAGGYLLFEYYWSSKFNYLSLIVPFGENLLGSWRNIAVVRSSYTISMYIDGAPSGETTVYMSSNIGLPLQLGADPCSLNNSTHVAPLMILDEVQFYDKVIDPVKIISTPCVGKANPFSVTKTSGRLLVELTDFFYDQFSTTQVFYNMYARMNETGENQLLEPPIFNISFSDYSPFTNFTVFAYRGNASFGPNFTEFLNFVGPGYNGSTTSLTTAIPTSSTSSSTTSTTTTTGCSTCNTTSCSQNNGGCDYRVSCNEGQIPLCGPCPPGTATVGSSCVSLCGDGNCTAEQGEDCVTCPLDCNSTTTCGACGDGACNAKETCSSCKEDCLCTTGPPPCPNKCVHGSCVAGNCVCVQPWTGPSCSTDSSQPLQPIFNTSNPSVTITTPTSSTQFAISLRTLSELDGNGNVLRSISLQNLAMDLVQSTQGANQIYNYSKTLENHATLHVIIWQIQETTTLTFAGNTTTFGPNTLKINVKIENWPFLALPNSLAIVLDSNAKNQENGGCVNSHSSDSGNLLWILVVVGKESLYGQFLDTAIVDDRVRKITYALLPDQTIQATLPHFWSYAEMDPNFNVLLGDSNTGPCKSKKNNNKLLALYIVVPVVAVALVVIAFLVFAPTIRTRWAVHKNRTASQARLNDSRDVEIEKIDSMEVRSHAGNFNVRM